MWREYAPDREGFHEHFAPYVEPGALDQARHRRPLMVLRFVFDQHVNARALRALREDGVDVVHVAEVGLSRADDPA